MAAFTSSSPRLGNLWTNHLRCFHLSALLSHIRILNRPVCPTNDYNPILNQESLPRFNEIRPTHVTSAIEELYNQFENDFAQFERSLNGKNSEAFQKENSQILSYSC